MSDRRVIETAGLWKRYDDVEALRGLDLQVPSGSIFGFLGRNGAGKTTTIKVLLGMARPTKGDARVFGLCRRRDAGVEIRRRTAFVSDEKDLYDYMTVGEMIAFTRTFYPKWRGDLEQQYLRKFELPPGRDIKGLSRGTRTKLALLLALCRGAELLILDEPTSGLDPAMAEDVLQALVGHVGRRRDRRCSSRRISSPKSSRSPITSRSSIAARPSSAGALDDLRARYQRVQLVFDGDAPDIRVACAGHASRAAPGPRADGSFRRRRHAVIDELRGYRPSSIDVSPVTLKDIFLESVRTED